MKANVKRGEQYGVQQLNLATRETGTILRTADLAEAFGKVAGRFDRRVVRYTGKRTPRYVVIPKPTGEVL